MSMQSANKLSVYFAVLFWQSVWEVVIISGKYISLGLIVHHQVSAEPDGSTYVFQGFIQGKDYGQFGLQRLGMGALPDIFLHAMFHCKIFNLTLFHLCIF